MDNFFDTNTTQTTQNTGDNTAEMDGVLVDNEQTTTNSISMGMGAQAQAQQQNTTDDYAILSTSQDNNNNNNTNNNTNQNTSASATLENNPYEQSQQDNNNNDDENEQHETSADIFAGLGGSNNNGNNNNNNELNVDSNDEELKDNVDKTDDEPTFLSVWQEQRRNELEKRRQTENENKQMSLEKATAEMEEFEADRAARIAAKQKDNRIKETQIREDLQSTFEHGTIWEQVGKMVSLQESKDPNSKDSDRMRVLLIGLKNLKK